MIDLRLAWDLAVTALAVSAAGAVAWLRLHFAPRATFDAEQRQQDDRLARIEQQLKDAPSHRDMERVSAQLSDVASRVSRVEGASTQTNRLLQAMHDHMLRGAK